jgi:DNA-binding winged helix-turn-helix (wHTH) protein
MREIFHIGEWSFDPLGTELYRESQKRRLEDRAARTLALLCERRGEVVSQADIISTVWNGRQVSPNSLPVVIADLRRALGDSARDPRFIETVAKRGYRLLPNDQVKPAPSARNKLVSRSFVIGFVLFLAVAAYASYRNSSVRPPQEITVFVPDVVNETGSPANAPMAAAVSERVSADLARLRVNFARVRPGQPAEEVGDGRRIQLTSKLILWTGKPTVMFTAEEDGRVTWSGMAEGPEPNFPASVHASMTEFAGTVNAPPTPAAKP